MANHDWPLLLAPFLSEARPRLSLSCNFDERYARAFNETVAAGLISDWPAVEVASLALISFSFALTLLALAVRLILNPARKSISLCHVFSGHTADRMARRGWACTFFPGDQHVLGQLFLRAAKRTVLHGRYRDIRSELFSFF